MNGRRKQQLPVAKRRGIRSELRNPWCKGPVGVPRPTMMNNATDGRWCPDALRPDIMWPALLCCRTGTVRVGRSTVSCAKGIFYVLVLPHSRFYVGTAVRTGCASQSHCARPLHSSALSPPGGQEGEGRSSETRGPATDILLPSTSPARRRQ